MSADRHLFALVLALLTGQASVAQELADYSFVEIRNQGTGLYIDVSHGQGIVFALPICRQTADLCSFGVDRPNGDFPPGTVVRQMQWTTASGSGAT